jgi:NAD(P)-dependent dehydrogenase (short-subunit alcohol dehydrogenase family)
MNPLDLTDKVIVVTGASSGIGRATAVVLSQIGARVVLSGRNRDRLSETLTLLEGSGHAMEAFDLTRTDDLPDWLKSVSESHGRIRGVAHCAGAQSIVPLRMLKTQQVEEMLRINVVSAIMLAKAFRQKGVNDSGGAMVLVSSVMGEVGAPGRAVYCASKGALHSLTKSLALEVAKEGIRVNCVAPGAVETGMVDAAAGTLGEAGMEEVRRLHPLGVGAPRDVAHAIAFLLADTGRWTTGTIQFIDGGYTAQ